MTSTGGIDVAGVIATVEPSVVSITTSVVVQQGPFRARGGRRHGRRPRRAGHVLTNAHVVAAPTRVTVHVNGEDRSATVLGADAAPTTSPCSSSTTRPASCRRRFARPTSPSATRSWPSATRSPSTVARPSPRASCRRSGGRSTPARATLDRPHPDRRRDQLRQLRRPARQRRRRGRRHQHRRRRRATAAAGLEHRLRHPDRQRPRDRQPVPVPRAADLAASESAAGCHRRRVRLRSMLGAGCHRRRIGSPVRVRARGVTSVGSGVLPCHTISSSASGRVVDGSGATARTADIAIDDGVITEVGAGRRPRPPARSTPTAPSSRPASSTSTPTTTARSTWDTELAPSSWHGVTTAVMGNCGVGFAPVRPADHDRLIELMEGVEDIPGVALHEGLSWDVAVVPRVPRRHRRQAARHRPRRPGPPRRDAPARDGRARRRPRAGHARRHRGDGRAGPPGDRGRRPRLHDVAARSTTAAARAS